MHLLLVTESIEHPVTINVTGSYSQTVRKGEHPWHWQCCLLVATSRKMAYYESFLPGKWPPSMGGHGELGNMDNRWKPFKALTDLSTLACSLASCECCLSQQSWVSFLPLTLVFFLSLLFIFLVFLNSTTGPSVEHIEHRCVMSRLPACESHVEM